MRGLSRMKSRSRTCLCVLFVTHPASGRIRLLCPACGHGRVFSTAELFSPTRSFVTLRKPCPHCGSDAPLRIQAPPPGAGVSTQLSQTLLRFDGPIAPGPADN